MFFRVLGSVLSGGPFLKGFDLFLEGGRGMRRRVVMGSYSSRVLFSNLLVAGILTSQ